MKYFTMTVKYNEKCSFRSFLRALFVEQFDLIPTLQCTQLPLLTTLRRYVCLQKPGSSLLYLNNWNINERRHVTLHVSAVRNRDENC